MSCPNDTTTDKDTPHLLPEVVLGHFDAISYLAPSMAGTALACLDMDRDQLDKNSISRWRAIIEKELKYYPLRASHLIETLLKENNEMADQVAEQLLVRFDYTRMSQAFDLCHSKLERIKPGAGRRLAQKVAMRALTYPMNNYWAFGQEPLSTLLARESVEGFWVEFAGGRLPWIGAWAVAALEEDIQPNSVGVAAVFDLLVSHGCDINGDVEDGPGGMAMALGCAAIEQGNPRGEHVVRLLMDAGAQWEHIKISSGSELEDFLLAWPGVKRSRLARLCPTKEEHNSLPLM